MYFNSKLKWFSCIQTTVQTYRQTEWNLFFCSMFASQSFAPHILFGPRNSFVLQTEMEQHVQKLKTTHKTELKTKHITVFIDAKFHTGLTLKSSYLISCGRLGPSGSFPKWTRKSGSNFMPPFTVSTSNFTIHPPWRYNTNVFEFCEIQQKNNFWDPFRRMPFFVSYVQNRAGIFVLWFLCR